jgi:excisionase family DNA binding protein
MRTATADHAAAAESDELLTTGEAAKILSSSRQHVVNLCNAGDLPFVTIGTHRRVRRRDVEALRARTQRPSRDERRSMWLNTAVAAKVVSDPDRTLSHARENLERLIADNPRGQVARWLGQWNELLDGPVERILETLTSPTLWAREMRQNSPFAGVLSQEERNRVLTAFKEYDGKSRP